jgi:2-hydroxychromene-2-carboxylate isomerase
MERFIESLGMSGAAYRAYLEGDGKREYEEAQQESQGDQIFGVPIFMFRGEQFWGNDRIPMLEGRLKQVGLSLDREKQLA